VVVHVYNPSTQEARGSGILGQPVYTTRLHIGHWVWGPMTVIPLLRRLRQEGYEFEVNQDHLRRLFLKSKERKKIKQGEGCESNWIFYFNICMVV
jgi:hypothetical protein